jgi:hypothetical protein
MNKNCDLVHGSWTGLVGKNFYNFILCLAAGISFVANLC